LANYICCTKETLFFEIENQISCLFGLSVPTAEEGTKYLFVWSIGELRLAQFGSAWGFAIPSLPPTTISTRRLPFSPLSQATNFPIVPIRAFLEKCHTNMSILR